MGRRTDNPSVFAHNLHFRIHQATHTVIVNFQFDISSRVCYKEVINGRELRCHGIQALFPCI